MSYHHPFPNDETVQTIADTAPRGFEYGKAPTNFEKVLKGNVYSSEDMESVATYTRYNPHYAYRHEELMRSKGGGFLLVGEGECCSPWTKKLQDCNDFVMAHAFVPLSVGDAKLWLELRGKDQEYFELVANLESEER